MEPLCSWSTEVGFPVTICDKEGIIVGMNHKSIEYYSDEGGDTLLGKSLLDCHPEPSRSKLKDLLRNPRPNTYLTQSKEEKIFVHQTPWFVNGIYLGFVEILIRFPSPAEEY